MLPNKPIFNERFANAALNTEVYYFFNVGFESPRHPNFRGQFYFY
jgi:hypothetical protein